MVFMYDTNSSLTSYEIGQCTPGIIAPIHRMVQSLESP
jgi:hypothetical protein